MGYQFVDGSARCCCGWSDAVVSKSSEQGAANALRRKHDSANPTCKDPIYGDFSIDEIGPHGIRLPQKHYSITIHSDGELLINI